MKYDVVIIGAGAAGLYCGATAAARGRRVLLIDHASAPARKLAITGGGKCNVTNRTVTIADYVGRVPQFARSALSRFTAQDWINQLEAAHIELEEREEGQLFCRHSAQDVITLLLSRCKQAGCEFLMNQKILDIQHHSNQTDHPFTVVLEDSTLRAHSLVIATGSPAWPQIGATDFGYRIGKQFGHSLVQPSPALVGLLISHDNLTPDLAGISIKASVAVIAGLSEADCVEYQIIADHKRQYVKNNQLITAHNTSLLFTHKGISGPATLQASLYWQPSDALIVNFLPERDITSSIQEKEYAKMLLKNCVRQFVPQRLADKLIPSSIAEKKVAELSKKDRELLFQCVHNRPLFPSRTEGLKKAEVCRGGISTDAISSKTFESSLVKGLFFCGEVLDITGRLGGYNLHWAFASGYAAGNYV